MAKVIVNPGICGLKTVIVAKSEDMQNATVEIETECPHINAMSSEIGTVDSFMECFKKPCEGRVYKAARRHCRHTSCPVPSAILKAIEVACCLSLPKDVKFEIYR